MKRRFNSVDWPLYIDPVGELFSAVVIVSVALAINYVLTVAKPWFEEKEVVCSTMCEDAPVIESTIGVVLHMTGNLSCVCGSDGGWKAIWASKLRK